MIFFLLVVLRAALWTFLDQSPWLLSEASPSKIMGPIKAFCTSPKAKRRSLQRPPCRLPPSLPPSDSSPGRPSSGLLRFACLTFVVTAHRHPLTLPHYMLLKIEHPLIYLLSKYSQFLPSKAGMNKSLTEANGSY